MASSLDRLFKRLNKLHKDLNELRKNSPYSVNIDKLRDDWRFLRTLWETIHQRDGADKMFVQHQNLGPAGGDSQSLALRIEAAAEEIAEEIPENIADKIAQNFNLPELLRDCQLKTKNFMAEIRGDLDHLSTFQVNSLPPDHSFWTSYVDSVRGNVWSIQSSTYIFDVLDRSLIDKQVTALFKELELIRGYVINVVPSVGRRSNYVTVYDFLGHVASVIVHIAIHSCSYWINYKTDHTQVAKSKLTKVVEELQYEIDPTNPKFMELHLKCLPKLYKFHYSQTESHFCHYLLGRSWKPQTDFQFEIKSLIILFVSNGLKGGDREDVQSFFAEINVLLVEAACLCEAVRKGDELNCPPNSELLTKICLLKAEHFLKKLLNDANDTSFVFLLKKIPYWRPD